MASNTVPDYEPKTYNLTVTPVLLDGAGDLTLVITPQEKAIWSWSNGGMFRVAVFDDLSDALRTGAVTADLVRNAIPTPGVGWNIQMSTMWADQGELFAAIRAHNPGAHDGLHYLYKADDIENPTVWTFHATIHYQNSSDGGIQGLAYGGPVIVTSTGTWVLPWAIWGNLFGVTDGSGIITSTNRGVSWSQQLGFRSGAFSALESDGQGTTVAEDPRTGHVFGWQGRDPNDGSENCIIYSTNGGANWARGAGIRSHTRFFTDNGVDKIWVALLSGGWRIHEAVDPYNPATWINTGKILHPSGSAALRFIRVPSGTPVDYVAIAGNSAAYAAPGGWQVGSLGFG